MNEKPRPWHYSMLVQWSEEDQAYVVDVPELPGCRTHASTYEEAVQRGQEAIEGWIEDARTWGEPVPEARIFAGAAHVSERG